MPSEPRRRARATLPRLLVAAGLSVSALLWTVPAGAEGSPPVSEKGAAAVRSSELRPPYAPPAGARAASSRGRSAAPGLSFATPLSTNSYYVSGSDAAGCGGGQTTSCPLYQEGAYTATPAGGGMVVLDFGAPCFVPASSPLIYGTQLFGTKTCAPLSSLLALAQRWLAGYLTTHGSGTPAMTLVLGTSNSATAVNNAPSGTLDQSQLQSHAAAWYSQVIGAVQTVGMAAAVTIWAGSDIEQSNSGDWYDAASTISWVTAYGQAAQLPAGICDPSVRGYLLDYGDNVVGGGPSTVDGWGAQQVYAVAWGLPATCAMPEIYYNGLADEWSALNQWATAQGQRPIQFTGVMGEPGAGLTPEAGWGQLQNQSGQTPPIRFLTTINHSPVTPAPVLSAAVPGFGSAGGGTVVSVTGSGFVNVTGVSFGTAPASFTVQSGTQLTAVSPPLAPGVVEIQVTAAAGTSSTSTADRFAVTGGGAYHPLQPARILDTRTGSGIAGSGSTLGRGSVLAVQVGGRGGVPASGAAAVVINVTAVDATASGYLTAYPAGGGQPLASNLNFAAGQTVPNLVEVPLGPGGAIDLFNAFGSVDVVVDVEGWTGPDVAGSGTYSPLSPARVLDTRPGSNLPGAGHTLAAASTVDVQVTGRGGVPAAGVAAVVMNLTATGPTTAGYLIAYPTGTPRPLASNLNFQPGQTAPNLIAVPIGSAGQVTLFNSAGSTDAILDVEGWISDGSNPSAPGGLYNPVPPARILDTRAGSGQPGAGQTLGGGQALRFSVAGLAGVPLAGVRGVVLNVTATGPTSSGYLSLYASGAALPLASNLNFSAGQTVANLVEVPVGAGGQVSVFNQAGSTDVVVDVEGWYA